MDDMEDDSFKEILSLPPLIYNPDDEPNVPKTILMHSKLDLVNTVAMALGENLFKRLSQTPLKNIIKLGRRTDIKFSGKLFHFLMQRRVLTSGEDLWFRFGCHPIRFSKREYYLTTGTI